MSILEHPDPQEVGDGDLSVSFSQDFIWGAATSAYQIEGAINEDGRGPSIWDHFSVTPGKTYAGHTGEIAVDHYHRYLDDIAMMRSLGLKAYRFSIAWSRILPTGTGAVNQAGLDFYDRLVDNLLAQGIIPVATLYHWDLPLALDEKGGWLNRATAEAFADYAEIMARQLGDRIPQWLTHNEPWCAAFMGYGTGMHAPGMRDMSLVPIVGHHLLLAHGLAVSRLRTHLPATAQVGITLNFTPAYAGDGHPATLAQVTRSTRHSRWFTDPLFKGQYPEGLFEDFDGAMPEIEAGDMEIISAPIDFLGINNYSRTLFRTDDDGVARAVDPVPGAVYTDLHWEVYPHGLRDLLVWLDREYAPGALYITENGSAFPDEWDGSSNHVDDPLRLAYLRDHIQAISEAVEQGVPVRGYFAWSLMDNFEWMDGYSKRFGLVYIDYPTQRRIIKASGHWYTRFIRYQQEMHNNT